MQKFKVIVDLILVCLFFILVTSNIFHFAKPQIVQPLFMVFLAIHLAQHWKMLTILTKNLFKKKK